MRPLFSIYPIIGLLLGIALFLWPWWAERRGREVHERRLNELNAGAEEAFFEEKRALKAYPPMGATGLRIAGIVLALLSLAILLLDNRQ